MPHRSDIDDLLAKHLAGESTSSEETDLQAWLDASAENQQYYASLQRLWQEAPHAAPHLTHAIDTETALRKVKAQLSPHQQWQVSPVRYGWWKWAVAAVFIGLVAAVWWWVRPSAVDSLQLVALHDPLRDTLTDGSVVMLSPGSSLQASAGFNHQERRLRLQGKGFFQVKPDAARPFFVDASGLEVQVVGTSFSVEEQAGQVVVEVAEGKVRLRAHTQQLYLQQGDRAVYDLSSHALKPMQPDATIAPSAREFRFSGTPLGEVVRQLSTAYGKQIVLQNPALVACPLRADYLNLSLEQVLERLSEAFSLQIQWTDDDRVLLDGEGCE